MHPQRWVLIAALALATGYLWLGGAFVGITTIAAGQSTLVTQTPKPGMAVATFASGCFWCTESDFDKLPGVISTTSGYTGGNVPNPTYKEVSSGRTGTPRPFSRLRSGHRQLRPARSITTGITSTVRAHRQFCDVGTQYRPVIFFNTEEQRAAAESSKARMQKMFKQPIVVAIAAAGPFYRAEEYHKTYQEDTRSTGSTGFGCGRDARLEEIWASATH